MNEIENKNWKFLSKVLIVSAAILVITGILLLAGVIGGDHRTDEEKLVDSTINTFLADAKEIQMLLTIEDVVLEGMEGMEAMFMKNLLKDISISVVMSQNDYSRESFMAAKLRMNNLVLIEANLYMDQERMAIHMPTLYSKTIYVNLGEIDQLMAAINFEQLDLPFELSKDMNRHKGTMSEEQKEAHEALFETIKEQLVARDYKAIESFDMPRYYELLTGFITTILTEEVVIEDVAIDGTSTSLTHYKMSTTAANLMELMESMSTATETDEKLIATKEMHGDSLGEPKEAGNYEFDEWNLEAMLINTEVSINDEAYIHKSFTTLDFAFPGIEGLIDGPVQLELGIEIEPVVKSETFTVPTLDLSEGIDLTGLSEEELKQFGHEFTDEMMVNLNDLLGTLGFDLEGLLGR